jgi:Tfp pilus assembly protein PilO
MRSNRREALLKVIVGCVAGLFLLDLLVLSPAARGWRGQGERIAALREKVQRGRQLLERERSIRERWAEMNRTDLPEDLSAAENDVFKAVGRWARDSRINFTSLTPQWRQHEEGYETLECRASATGDQASLARFLYELESDPAPVHLQESQFTTRDARGQQLLLSARFSFVRLQTSGKAPR